MVAFDQCVSTVVPGVVSVPENWDVTLFAKQIAYEEVTLIF
jgi:hypothetical protein